MTVLARADDPRDDWAMALHDQRAEDVARRLATVFHGFDDGFAVRTDTLALVYSLNTVYLRAASGAAHVTRAAEDHQRDLSYRHVHVAGPDGPDVEQDLAELGWRVERDCVMAMTADMVPDEAPGRAARTLEIDEAGMLELMAQWLREELPTITDEGLRQVLEFNRREGRVLAERRVGCVDPRGAPLAVAKLRVFGDFGSIDDVFVAAHARGRGLGRLVVDTAIREAVAEGCWTIGIVADDDDWPKHLYGRLGFRRVGTGRVFHLDAG